MKDLISCYRERLDPSSPDGNFYEESIIISHLEVCR